MTAFSFGRGLSPALAMLSLCLTIACFSCYAQSAPGKQALTVAIQKDTTTDPEIRKYNELTEMLLDMKMNHAQRAQLRNFADSYRYSVDWQKQQTFYNCLAFYDQIMAKPAAERQAYCRHLTATTVLEQWKLAKFGDPEARFMLDLYYSALPPIAPGALPLTADVVDALIDFDYFFNTEVKGLKTGPIDDNYRRKMHEEAVAKWKTLDAAGQQAVFESASQVGLHRLQWAQASPDERLMIRARVVGASNLSPAEQQRLAVLQQRQASFSQQQSQLITNELQYMRQNQQIIMGNGTYYNQTLGRWEQHGGIVTEFH